MSALRGSPTLLGSHPNARTTEVSKAEEAVSRYLNNHELVDTTDDFALVHNVADVGSIALHYIHYGGGVSVRPLPQSDQFYLVQVPLSGSMRIRNAGRDIVVTEGGAVASVVGLGETPMEYSENCPRLMVQLPLATLRQGASRVLPGTIDLPSTSLLPLDVSTGAGHSWLKLLLWILTDVDSPEGMVARSQGAQYLESLIVDGLLLAQHDQAEALPAPSRTVSLAIEFMRAHLDEPLTPARIASEVFVSVRALQGGFRRELGTTPMSFLRDLRLDAVHLDLQGAVPGQASVAEFAHRRGVNHLGRFAGDYRERFGVTPSETLRSIRRIAA